MSSILGRICFLADLPLYNTEKPFLALLAPDVNARLAPDIPRHNLEWEEHILKVRDIRNCTGYQLETSGFEASFSRVFDMIGCRVTDRSRGGRIIRNRNVGTSLLLHGIYLGEGGARGTSISHHSQTCWMPVSPRGPLVGRRT